MTSAAWSCRCGATHGRLDPSGGTRVLCHCDSCARAQRHFGADIPPQGSVDILQTTPDRITIEAGLENLRLAQLSPKGSYRWYAACCNTQIGITGKTMRFPFLGLIGANVTPPESLGPVRGRGFVPQPGGGTKHHGTFRLVRVVFGRAIAAWTSSRWKENPFFDHATGAPIAEAELLSRDAGRL